MSPCGGALTQANGRVRQLKSFTAQVRQYLLDHLRIFDARDDFHAATADTTRFDVDVEHPLQTLRPAHRCMAGEQKAQWIREAQYPLAHRLFRQDLGRHKAAALSAMRRAPPTGQRPRAVAKPPDAVCSAWQLLHCTRRKPCPRPGWPIETAGFEFAL